MRSALITLGSVVLTAGVLANAYFHKKQFYPTVVYITKSSPSMAVLYLQAFVLVLLLGKLMRKLFFSQLRSAELEHLIERSWYAVTETCLAFTVFRDDFSPRFVALFTILLFLKCFHWLAEDRIDYMERSPVITFLFHLRAVSLLLLLANLDIFFVRHAYANIIKGGASVQLVFGFEYAILVTVVAHVFVKYILHTVDLNRETPWDSKAVYLLYAEVALGFVKCLLYVLFLAIMIKVHTFPLFVIRPMYLTIREFKKALNDVVMSRRAIYNMNTRYPDATAEDLSSGDNVCIICREEMQAGAGPGATVCKKLPCSHIFHASCLRSWFQRQQTCPTCRMDVLRQTDPRDRAQRQAQEAQPPAAPPAQQAWPNGAQNPLFAGWPGFPGGPQAPWHQGLPPQTLPSSQVTSTTGGTFVGAVPPPPMPPPFMMPPPPMPMMMYPPGGQFMAPPCPPPPQNLAALTEEQLRILEGAERENVEARIRTLQDINTLLTAALTQMNQFITHAPPVQPNFPPAAAFPMPFYQPATPYDPYALPLSVIQVTSASGNAGQMASSGAALTSAPVKVSSGCIVSARVVGSLASTTTPDSKHAKDAIIKTNDSATSNGGLARVVDGGINGIEVEEDLLAGRPADGELEGAVGGFETNDNLNDVKEDKGELRKRIHDKFS